MANHAHPALSRSLRFRPLSALAAAAFACAVALAPAPSSAQTEGPQHAIAMHGAPALPAGFPHFRYANPDAPQGGNVVLGLLGTFDSLNPFVVRGLALQQVRGYVVESLLTRGYDEPFTLYGLLAQTVETDEARSFVTFTLDPRGRFSDGRPVTPADVVFSWRLLRDKGRPNYRAYYTKVAKATIIGERSVRFDFAEAGDRELPLILGLLPVFAAHATDEARFEETTFTAPIGSGPYRVESVRPGEQVVLKRRPDYWGRDLGVARGFWNFEQVRFDFYRDANTHFEAFAKGLYDVRAETDPGRWERAYDIPAARDGRIIKDTFPNGLPKGMTGLVFNTRRALFADVRVREAIGLLFDFEWVNRSFFFGRYRRTDSYFAGSELSSRGRPASPAERSLLAAFPQAVRSDILEGSWAPDVSDGSGRDRHKLTRALELLKAAGWVLERRVLRERRSGRAFSFELLVTTKDQERLALAFARDLARAGIVARIRLVDAVQFDRRRDRFEFDMLQYSWSFSLSPGNEQAFYWGSAAAKQEGSRNYMGAQVPAIDAMVDALIAAPDRPTLVAAARALDRVLLSGFYVVPLFHLPEQWVVRRTDIRHPDATSLFGYLLETWWRQPQTP